MPKTSPQSLLACLPLIVVSACLAGCSQGHELDTAQVRGKVTLDGRPLESGGVIFIPARGRAATGIVQSDGIYTLGTYQPGDGAVVGGHSVTINPHYPNQGNDEENTRPANANIFTVPRSFTGINVLVEPGKVNVIDIPLKSTP